MCPSNLAKETVLIISDKEMNDVIKIVTSIEESGLLIKKELAKQLKMKEKNKKEDFC